MRRSNGAFFLRRGFSETRVCHYSNPTDPLHTLILLGIRTGKYSVILDKLPQMDDAGVDQGVYNEDMAVAIVDEVEANKLNHRHWTFVGPIGLKQW